MKAYIKSIGGYLPENIVTNDDLAAKIDTSDEWIVQRTGIKQRHFAAEGELTSDMAFEAAKQALERADLKADDIDLIMVATTTPDYTFPSTATILQNKLGCQKLCPAFDLQAVCAGFIFGLDVATKFVESGQYRNILLVAAEKMSSVLNWEDRTTSVLFGDGAGAVVVSEAKNGNGEIFKAALHADGSQTEILKTNGGVAFNGGAGLIEMKGREVFKHAVKRLAEVSLEVLQKNGFSANEVDLVVPHQANVRIINSVVEKLGVPDEKVIKTVQNHANTSAASIPLALNDAFERKLLKRGDLVLVEAFGAGLSWGGGLFRF